MPFPGCPHVGPDVTRRPLYLLPHHPHDHSGRHEGTKPRLALQPSFLYPVLVLDPSTGLRLSLLLSACTSHPHVPPTPENQGADTCSSLSSSPCGLSAASPPSPLHSAC